MKQAKTETQQEIKARRRRESKRVLARLKEVLPAVLAKHPVVAAYAHGSVARGTMTSLNNVDIALLLSTSRQPYEGLKLELTIQAEIEDASGLSPVDVRAINSAPLMVQGRVVEKGVLLYEGDRAGRIAFEVMTQKRYFDFAPVDRRLRKAFLERVRREGLLRG